MKVFKVLGRCSCVGSPFAGGYVVRATKAAARTATPARKVLYYVDPMHPAYKSDKPGIAPDCGMTLEPVYAMRRRPPDTRHDPTTAIRRPRYRRQPG